MRNGEGMGEGKKIHGKNGLKEEKSRPEHVKKLEPAGKERVSIRLVYTIGQKGCHKKKASKPVKGSEVTDSPDCQKERGIKDSVSRKRGREDERESPI